MVIATFGPGTGWAGRVITYENGTFTLEGHGTVTARDVVVYDQHGYLTWAYDGLLEWVRGLAASEPAPSRPPESTPAAVVQGGSGKQPSGTAAAQPKHRLPGWAWALLGLLLVALLVAVVLVSSGTDGGGTQTGAIPPAAPAPSGTPSPASVEVTSLEADRNEVGSGWAVAVTAEFANLGGKNGTYDASLKVDGKVVAERQVTVPAGRGDVVTFKVRLRGDRVHRISLGGRSIRVRSVPTVRYPNGHILRWDAGHGPGRLTVKNGGKTDGVVLFCTPTKKPKAMAAVYVRGRSKVVVRHMPDTGFYVYCILGKGWSPEHQTFVDVESRVAVWDTGFWRRYYFDGDPTTVGDKIYFFNYTVSVTSPLGDAEPKEVPEDKMPSLK